MNRNQNEKEPRKRLLPPMGQRIQKTGAAVMILLILYMLQGGHGDVGSAIVTAILCMQPYVRDTRTFARERILGTLLGALWAIAFLLLMQALPALAACQPVMYAVMTMFVMLGIYGTVVIRMPSVAGLTAIVFICTVAGYPNVAQPLTHALETMLDTILGTLVAIGVNIARLPRRKHPERLFFVRSMDLVPTRYQQIPSAVHIALDHLYQEGARICIVSRWAPAYIISQMGLLKVNVPMIIMDGAGLYDIGENRYLDVIPIPRENADRLHAILAGFGVGVNYYCVNEYTMTICHEGPMNAEEKREVEAMKRSPYRHYSDGLPREEDYIAFMRVIGPTAQIDELAYQAAGVLPSGMFRMVRRVDDMFPDASGLYFYDSAATVENMKRRVVKIMTEKDGSVPEPEDILPSTAYYRPEHDAMHLLHRLKERYEPVSFFRR